MRQQWRVVGGGALAVLALVAGLATHAQSPTPEWRYCGGDKAFTRYSPLDQITARPTSRTCRSPGGRPGVRSGLKQAYSRPCGSRATPIDAAHDRRRALRAERASGSSARFDPATGATVGTGAFARHMKKITAQPARRRLLAEAATTSASSLVRGEDPLRAQRQDRGATTADFGEQGRVHPPLESAARRASTADRRPDRRRRRRRGAGATAGAGDGGAKKEAAPEDVRGFDVRTGKLLWTFHVDPAEAASSATTRGAASRGSTRATPAPWVADDGRRGARLRVPAADGADRHRYGGQRPGNNLFADIARRARREDRQARLALPDRPPRPLGLRQLGPRRSSATSPSNGRRDQGRRAADQAGVRCTCSIARPASRCGRSRSGPCRSPSVPGERTSPTQPFPTKPPAFDRQGVTDDDLIDFTPELRAQALAGDKHVRDRDRSTRRRPSRATNRAARKGRSRAWRVGRGQLAHRRVRSGDRACTTPSRTRSAASERSSARSRQCRRRRWTTLVLAGARQQPHAPGCVQRPRSAGGGAADPEAAVRTHHRVQPQHAASRSGWSPTATVRAIIRC